LSAFKEKNKKRGEEKDHENVNAQRFREQGEMEKALERALEKGQTSRLPPAKTPLRISGPLVSRAMASGLPSRRSASLALSTTDWWYYWRCCGECEGKRGDGGAPQGRAKKEERGSERGSGPRASRARSSS